MKLQTTIDKLKELQFSFTGEMYEQYLFGELTLKEIQQITLSKVNELRTFFKENNIRYRASVIDNFTNHTIFDNIDSELKAYLLGFYLADGCLTKKSSTITISVSEKDKELIELFRAAICMYNKITISKPYKNKTTGFITKPMATITFRSKHIADTLTKYKMGIRKTYSIIDTLDFIPNNLMIHFIRGYFDGDGTVHCSNIEKIYKIKSGETRISKSRNFNWSILSNKSEHLILIQKFLKDNYNISSNILNDSRGHYLLEINKKEDFFKFRDILYKNSEFYLKRKKDKYMEIPC